MESILGKPYTSAEQAGKAKRSALLGLCLILVIQVAVGLFFWWISRLDNSLSSSGFTTPQLDAIIVFIFAVYLYFKNSRIAAGILLALSVYGLVSTWILKYTTLGEISPPAIGLIMVVVAAQLAIAVFKTHAWEQAENPKPVRSKWVMWSLIGTFVLLIAGFFVPPMDFLLHTRYDVSIADKGNVFEYYEPLDQYTIEYPKTWGFEHPAMEYGNVILSPTDASNVTVKVERWQPWSIAPVQLFNKDAFLKMAQDEADAYSTENDLRIDSVELVEPSNVNKARVAYSGADGSKRYVYYIYNKAWSRQTSDAAYFFWRLTAEVPSGTTKYDAEAQAVLSSFVVEQTARN